MRSGGHADAHQAALSEVAHLFRTPLGVITGYLQLLELRDDPEFRADALRELQTAAEKLVSTVNVLITVLEAERYELSERLVVRARALERRGSRSLDDHKDPAGA